MPLAAWPSTPKMPTTQRPSARRLPTISATNIRWPTIRPTRPAMVPSAVFRSRCCLREAPENSASGRARAITLHAHRPREIRSGRSSLRNAGVPPALLILGATPNECRPEVGATFAFTNRLTAYFSFKRNQRQETFAVRNCAAKILGDGLAHVGQRVTNAEADGVPPSRAVRHNWYVFPRMIRRRPRGIGIAAMIGGDQQQVARRHGSQQRREKNIEFFQGPGKSLHVLPVPIEHVEIHEVRENEAGVLRTECRMQLLHAVGVVPGGDVALDAPAVVDVVNLADAEDRHFALDQYIHQHGVRRLNSVIVAALGAPEIPRRSSKGPRDDSADFVRSDEHFARDLAHAVKLADGNHVFVRRNLEYAVARGVNDRKSRAQMFFA